VNFFPDATAVKPDLVHLAPAFGVTTLGAP